MASLPEKYNGLFPSRTGLGGYPLYYLTERHAVVCPTCANTETSDPATDADVNWEDASLYCDDCSQRIPSAYAEPD